MKKVFLLMLVLILPACSSLGLDDFKFNSTDNVSTTKIIEDYEKVKQIISVSDGKAYILTENYDFEFSGEQAKILKEIVNINNIIGRHKTKSPQYKIDIDLNGVVNFGLSSIYDIEKKSKEEDKPSKEFLKNQEEKATKFRNKLKENDIKFNFTENPYEYCFYIKDSLKAKGKIVKLENRDEILSKNKLEDKDLKVSISVEKNLSQKEYEEKVNKAKFKDFKDKVAFALVSPFIVAAVVTIAPVVYIGSLIESN